MKTVVSRTGDDELLLVLMDAPTRWLVKNDVEAVAVSSLRQALRLAYKFSAGKNFTGNIFKQPDDEMVVEPGQINRLWHYLGFVNSQQFAA